MENTRMAISDKVAAYICWDNGLSPENIKLVLKETKQPTAGYYYSDDIKETMNKILVAAN